VVPLLVVHLQEGMSQILLARLHASAEQLSAIVQVEYRNMFHHSQFSKSTGAAELTATLFRYQHLILFLNARNPAAVLSSFDKLCFVTASISITELRTV
jgi:hypothetical protein